MLAIVLALVGLVLLDVHAEPPRGVPAEERRLQAMAQLDRAGVSYSGVAVGRDGQCILDLTSSDISDLSPLRNLPVDFICLRYSPNVRDLAPMAGMRLTGLNLVKTSVSDLSPLASMPLKSLEIACTKVRDLSPLKGMPLTYLNAAETLVKDLAPLRGLQTTVLILNRTNVSDLRPLIGMPLTSLHVGETPVIDLRPLEGLELEELFFPPERIKFGLDVVRGMKSLRYLGGGKVSTHFLGVAEFWDRYDHGDPVDHWLEAVEAGQEMYAPEPEPGHLDPAREMHLRELIERLGDERFANREAAEKSLSTQSRSIIPFLMKHAPMDDPEIQYRVRHLVHGLRSDPAKTPCFAFAFQRKLPMTPEQWRRAMEPWRAKSKTGEAHMPAGSTSGEMSPFAQSFTADADRICAVELMVYAAHGGQGWLKVDLCQDDGGKPSPTAMARTWIRIDTVGLPPHNVYLPIDLPDTEVVADKTYWLTYCEVPDRDSPKPGIIQTGASRSDVYPRGRILLPQNCVDVRWSASFRVVTDCLPVPLLRKLTDEESAALPDPSAVQVIWQSPGS